MATEVTIPSGTKLGRYEIRSQIDAGGMGEVYLVEDTRDGAFGVYAGLGDKDHAYAQLEKDFQVRTGLLTRTRRESSFESLRGGKRIVCESSRDGKTSISAIDLETRRARPRCRSI